jgi:hypothetical protein
MEKTTKEFIKIIEEEKIWIIKQKY